MNRKIDEHTIWRLVDEKWRCIYRNYVQDGTEVNVQQYDCTLADYLWLHEFEIPDYIDYCLAKNTRYSMKYRVYGGSINIYISDL